MYIQYLNLLRAGIPYLSPDNSAVTDTTLCLLLPSCRRGVTAILGGLKIYMSIAGTVGERRRPISFQKMRNGRRAIMEDVANNPAHLQGASGKLADTLTTLRDL